MRARGWFAAGVAAVVASSLAGEGWSGTNEPPAAVPRAAPPARIELGRRLFFDPAVSRTGRVSCASCHDPDHGFTDLAHPSADESGPSKRRSMPLADLAAVPLHSDGEFRDLRDLLEARLRPFADLDPLHDATLRAFGFATYAGQISPPPAFARVADRVTDGGFYADAFADAFGDPAPTLERVMDAIEAYSYSIRTDTNALDRYLAGETNALNSMERRGLALFEGKAGCAACHVTRTDGERAPLHDGRFHDVGIAWRSARLAGMNDPGDGDPGLGAHGKRSADRRRDHMRFRTPSLRDVARRGPYMHDGSMRTLIDVLEFFDAGGERHRGLDEAVRPLGLTEAEKDEILAFLLALSGPERAGLGPPPAWLGRSTTVRLVTPEGRPLARTEVAVEAAGDRFQGLPSATATRLVRTDATGCATFAFPPSTHVSLRVDGFVVGGGRLLPDLAGDRVLLAVPEDSVVLRVIGAGGKAAPQIRAHTVLVSDELGRPVKQPEGDTIHFKLARRISDKESVYVARRPQSPSSARRLLVPRASGGSICVGQADVDVSGGGVTYLDMRPQHEIPPTMREEHDSERR